MFRYLCVLLLLIVVSAQQELFDQCKTTNTTFANCRLETKVCGFELHDAWSYKAYTTDLNTGNIGLFCCSSHPFDAFLKSAVALFKIHNETSCIFNHTFNKIDW